MKLVNLVCSFEEYFPSTGWFLEKKNLVFTGYLDFFEYQCAERLIQVWELKRDAWNFSFDSFKEALMPKSHIKETLYSCSLALRFHQNNSNPSSSWATSFPRRLACSFSLLARRMSKKKKRACRLDDWDWTKMPIRLPIIVIYTNIERYNTNIERITWEVPMK